MRHAVRGVVQGVGFRPFVYRLAAEMGLRGYVRNTGSEVEIVIDGDDALFLERLRSELPALARIDEVRSEPLKKGDAFDGFRIELSTSGERRSPVPPDVGLCAPCRREMADRGDRRFGFPFTNCTDCGARFSVISDVPYDRKNTTMAPFPMCPDCLAEYSRPADRRFHAQTTSCPGCGPRYSLHDGRGAPVDCPDPIERFARELDAGAIGVVKSWGGMHIACAASELARMRKWYRRPAKPFAVMVRDAAAARRYARLDGRAMELLASPRSPIVLAPKAGGETEAVQELAAPGLDRIGLYLPYSGVQILLFNHLRTDALVMTSANAPGEPMATTNAEAARLGADWLLLHNRDIANRCDDSVILPHERGALFLRKSRGWVPDPMNVPHNGSVVCMGAERNCASSFAQDGRLQLSQYIGNTTHYDVLVYLERATKHLERLFGLERLDAYGADSHPAYESARLAERLAKASGTGCVRVQHHFAHAASLMVDAQDFGPLPCVALDGTGWGTDETVWGGEALLLDQTRQERLMSLGTFPLIGGDQAVRDPRRLAFAMEQALGRDSAFFSGRDADNLALAAKRAVQTSSMGRVLDALAVILGVCTERTYDGEPAIRLERYLARAADAEPFDVNVLPGSPARLDVRDLFGRLYDSMPKEPTETERARLASAFVSPLVRELARAAAQRAEREGAARIGLSGGIAYNIPIMDMARREAERSGVKLLVHERLPCGDGGISAGQNLLVGWALGL